MKKNFLVPITLSVATLAAGAQTHLRIPASPAPSALPTTTSAAPARQTMPSGGAQAYEQVQRQVMSENFNSRSEGFYDYQDLKLPPLELLFERARENPRTTYHNLRRAEAESNLKSVKRAWLRYLNINAGYRYGYLGVSDGMEVPVQNPNAGPPTSTYDPTKDLVNMMQYSYFNQRQSWWNVGAAISMPLDQIFDNGNRVRRARLIVEQSQYEADTWYEEQKLKVVESYANAGMYLNLIRIKSETATLTQQEYAMKQADFINGRATMTELAFAKGSQNDAVNEYEETRAMLYEAILRLETLCNYKILNQ